MINELKDVAKRIESLSRQITGTNNFFCFGKRDYSVKLKLLPGTSEREMWKILTDFKKAAPISPSTQLLIKGSKKLNQQESKVYSSYINGVKTIEQEFKDFEPNGCPNQKKLYLGKALVARVDKETAAITWNMEKS